MPGQLVKSLSTGELGSLSNHSRERPNSSNLVVPTRSGRSSQQSVAKAGSSDQAAAQSRGQTEIQELPMEEGRREGVIQQAGYSQPVSDGARSQQQFQNQQSLGEQGFREQVLGQQDLGQQGLGQQGLGEKGLGQQRGTGLPQQAGDYQQASGYVYRAGYQQPAPRVYRNPQGPVPPADAMSAEMMQREMYRQEMNRQEMIRQQAMRQGAMQQRSLGNLVNSYNPSIGEAVAPPIPDEYPPAQLQDSSYSPIDMVSPQTHPVDQMQPLRSNQYGGYSTPDRPYRTFDPTQSQRTHNGFLENGPTMLGGTLDPYPRTATDHALELKADNLRLREAEIRRNQMLADKTVSLKRAQALINERDKQLADSRIRNNGLEKQISRLSAQLKVAEADKAEIKRQSEATLKSIESTLDSVLLQSISRNSRN